MRNETYNLFLNDGVAVAVVVVVATVAAAAAIPAFFFFEKKKINSQVNTPPKMYCSHTTATKFFHTYRLQQIQPIFL